MSNQIRTEPEKTYRSDTRQRFIAAAYVLLAEKGVEATTVKEIARLAGVSSGLFSYYFASKDELLREVLHEAGRRFKQRLSEAFQTVPRNDFPETALALMQEITRKEPAWFRLRYEFYALGLRNPAFASAVGQLLTRIRQQICQTLQSFADIDEAQGQMLAAIILACFDGLALQQLTQPDFDLTTAYHQLRQMIILPPLSEA
jgi:AcrR family transcriptional regulator